MCVHVDKNALHTDKQRSLGEERTLETGNSSGWMKLFFTASKKAKVGKG